MGQSLQLLIQLLSSYRQEMTQIPRPLNEVYSIFDQTLLGKGSTGNVYLGCSKENPNQRVAIKSINLHQINNEVTRYLLSCEIAALSNLGKLQNTQHENVVRLLQIIILQNFIYLVMQMLQGGTLAQYIKKHPNGLPEEEALSILKQILQGYQRIKNKFIVHRDLKPDNIIFKVQPHQSKNVAIIDFGYCEMKQVPNKPMMFYNVGSPKYMSPQAYKENKYSEKSDIWAIGVMLYEMLLGKTCDNGMNMQNYLEMLQTKGIPLPIRLKNIHKHLLSRMLTYNPESRIQSDEALKILNHHLNSFQRPNTHNFVPSKQGLQNLRDIREIIPSEKPNKNNVIFNSTLQLTRSPSTHNIQSQQNFQPLRLLRKVPGMSQSYKNLQEIKIMERNPGISFHNQQSNTKRVFLPQRINKIQNVEFSSAKQIIHRNSITNHATQFKNVNVTPFQQPSKGSFQPRFNIQNFSQPSINIQITPTNRKGNQQIKVNQFPSLLRASIPSIHKQEQSSSNILSQSAPQNIHLLEFTNQKVIANPLQHVIIREAQNFNQPSLIKPVSKDVQFMTPQSFRANQFGRQSQQIPRSSFPQNKANLQNFYKPRASHDVTLTKNSFSELTQSVMSPHQDLTLTRIPYQNFQQNATPLTDLAQTKISNPILYKDSTIGKTLSGPHESNTYHKSIVQLQTSLNFINKQQQPQKIIMNGVQNKPFQTVRKVIHLKAQTAAIRKIENKTNYMRLNAYPQTAYRQEAHLMMLHPSVVK